MRWLLVLLVSERHERHLVVGVEQVVDVGRAQDSGELLCVLEEIQKLIGEQ